MMQVSNVNAVGNAMSAVKEQPDIAADSVSKDIQSKIMDAQKQRQELSSDTEMSAEEKADKRQKIQQEISDLKRELRLRQEEEKKKQQEAQKAAEAKKEQKENATREAVKKQQRTQSAQNADGRQQEDMSGSDSGRKADVREAVEENWEKLPGVMHKSISKEAAVKQIRIVRNTAAQTEGTFRVREAEISQDAARGADVESLKKQHREDIQKDARRVERVRSFMFEGNSKSAEPAAGVVKQVSGGARGKGLYNNIGMMFKTNFQSVQMDMKQ